MRGEYCVQIDACRGEGLIAIEKEKSLAQGGHPQDFDPLDDCSLGCVLGRHH